MFFIPYIMEYKKVKKVTVFAAVGNGSNTYSPTREYKYHNNNKQLENISKGLSRTEKKDKETGKRCGYYVLAL